MARTMADVFLLSKPPDSNGNKCFANRAQRDRSGAMIAYMLCEAQGTCFFCLPLSYPPSRAPSISARASSPGRATHLVYPRGVQCVGRPSSVWPCHVRNQMQLESTEELESTMGVGEPIAVGKTMAW